MQTYSFSAVPKSGTLLLPFLMVDLGNVQKLVELMKIIHFLIVCCSKFVYS